MSTEDIERRFAEIDEMSAEELTSEQAAALASAEEIDDGSEVSLDEYRREAYDYSGKINIHVPKSLHKKLLAAAKNEGVSLNMYIMYKLTRAAN